MGRLSFARFVSAPRRAGGDPESRVSGRAVTPSRLSNIPSNVISSPAMRMGLPLLLTRWFINSTQDAMKLILFGGVAGYVVCEPTSVSSALR